MGWLKENDITPYKRLFKQQDTQGSLMGRGLNPTEKYKAQGGISFGQYGLPQFPTYQPATGAGSPTGSWMQPTPSSLGSSSSGGSGFGNFLSQGFKGMPGLGNIASGIGGLFQGYGAYKQAKGQQGALDLAINRAGKVPGMIDRMYQPGIDRTTDLYNQYNPRGGMMMRNLQRNLTGGINQSIGQVDPSQRKLLRSSGAEQGEQAMQRMMPQFAQAQGQIGSQLTGMELGRGQAQIGAQENLAELQAARKSINPTASALGSFGASLMSFVQGGGKLQEGSSPNINIEKNSNEDYSHMNRFKQAMDSWERGEEVFGVKSWNEYIKKYGNEQGYDLSGPLSFDASNQGWAATGQISEEDKQILENLPKDLVLNPIQKYLKENYDVQIGTKATNLNYINSEIGKLDIPEKEKEHLEMAAHDLHQKSKIKRDVISALEDRYITPKRKYMEDELGSYTETDDMHKKADIRDIVARTSWLRQSRKSPNKSSTRTGFGPDELDNPEVYEGGGYISGPHHGAGGVDMGNNIEAQGGEFMMNANAYNKNPSMLKALNMNDNEMTIMNGFFGDKHSAHGNSLNMQDGGELDANEMSDYQKYLVVRGNKPNEFEDSQDFDMQKQQHEMQKGGGMMNEGTILNKIINKTYGI